jgi:hypothetical protein
MGYLETRLQEVADLAGHLDHQDQFSTEYERLLGELTQALRAMKALAVLQGGWLQGRLAQRGKLN